MHQLLVLLTLVLTRMVSCLPTEKMDRPAVEPRCDSERELLDELHKIWPGEGGGVLDNYPPMDLDDLVAGVEEYCGDKVNVNRHEWQVFLATALKECYQTQCAKDPEGSKQRQLCEARCRKRFVPRSQRADPNILFGLGPPDRASEAASAPGTSTRKRKSGRVRPDQQEKVAEDVQPETDPDAPTTFSLVRSTARELFDLGSAVVGQGARYVSGRNGAQHGKSSPLRPPPPRRMMFMRPPGR